MPLRRVAARAAAAAVGQGAAAVGQGRKASETKFISLGRNDGAWSKRQWTFKHFIIFSVGLKGYSIPFPFVPDVAQFTGLPHHHAAFSFAFSTSLMGIIYIIVISRRWLIWLMQCVIPIFVDFTCVPRVATWAFPVSRWCLL